MSQSSNLYKNSLKIGLPYFPANKPTRRISRDQLFALKMRVLPYYHPISQGRKFDQRGAAPDQSSARHYVLWQFEVENAKFICFNRPCKYDTDRAEVKIW